VQSLSGFRLEPVAGLVAANVFLSSLSEGVFLSTQYIRHHSAPLYTPEPDVVHEVVGHAVTLASPRLAELNRLFGEAIKRARSNEDIETLSRVYWFTIEFGVVREGGDVKAYGAGLVSSAGEMDAMASAEIRPLDFQQMWQQIVDPTSFQPVLFCAESFEEMYSSLRSFLIDWKPR
jgi:phenylalanine-4-hydroxylase